MLSNTNDTTYHSNQNKYYALTTVLFLVALSLHSSVYHRFALMEQDLVEAASIKFKMQWDELKAIDYYQKSVHEHRRGIQDTVWAYKYAEEAEVLRESVFEEEDDIQRLKEDAREKEQQAKIDMRESAIYGMTSFRDNRASAQSTVTGMDLARQAEDENERSEVLMNRTADDEALGKKKLLEAREALEIAEVAQNQTKLDKGICKWASVICNAVHTNNEDREYNHTAAVTASDAVIKANNDILDALEMIHKAELERSEAIELHRNASIHANLSTEILGEAQAFQKEAVEYWKIAQEYRANAMEEESEAQNDEEKAFREQEDIGVKIKEIKNDTERSVYLFERVNKDRYMEQVAHSRMNREWERVRKRRVEWENKKEEAIHHVAKAGWGALLASISGLCLLVVVSTRIFAAFRYQQPLGWILREPPYFLQDLWYLICHICIFVLAMAYVGELLMSYHHQTNTVRTGITIIFALIATSLQVTLLHLIPSMYGLFRDSRIESDTIRLLFKQVIVQKGSIIALISAIEMLLCWCWTGTAAFKEVHKLNTYLAWLVVLSMSFGYGCFLQTRAYRVTDYLPSDCGTELGNSQNNSSNERNSLLPVSFIGNSQGPISVSSNDAYVIPDGSPPMIQDRSNTSNESLPSRMQSISIDSEDGSDDYGSLSSIFKAHLSTSPLKFSWEAELLKVRLLFEFWLASFALWILRRDLTLIRKLSPLATGIVWGQMPLWILNACLFVLFASLTVIFAKMKFER